ncbi:MAG: phospho-N-acetylmuramoyl-pentapeptide-transferase, partial [Holosporales bacterium]|nr:phospho-N-acetylmuramoyl-pentapeptide-transferase [Holosporales bacterium]
MFYSVIYKLLGAECSYLNILKYVTFRSICAFFTSFFIVLLTGNRFILLAKEHQGVGQPIRDDGPQSHIKDKKGTPTMGGILIILSVIAGTLLFCDFTNTNLWLCIAVFFGFGVIGAADDYKKVTKHDYHGISGKKKFLLQTVVAITCCYLFTKFCQFPSATSIFLPIFKNCQIELWYFFIIWAAFIVIGSSNAVNLTDGLDGLAMGPVIMSSICFAVISYLVGNTIFAKYLQVQYVPGMSEVCIFLSALV